MLGLQPARAATTLGSESSMNRHSAGSASSRPTMVVKNPWSGFAKPIWKL